jgi:hypothetical protein
LYIETRAVTARDAVRRRRLGRLGLGAWAAVVYLLYWLGQLGMR